jgi:glutamyl-tRNA synthetase
MILRIEDTDQNRFVPGAEEYIVNSLSWCGLVFDESPERGGPFAPYRQSERPEVYKEQIERLLGTGHAYYAFDTEEELNSLRDKTKVSGGNVFQYDQKNRSSLRNSISLPEEEVKKYLEEGVPYVIRIKIPVNEQVVLHDMIRGEVVVDTANLDDKVLFKSDGLPTYHLANVVDDYLMKITHVIRGEEWLPSAPLHVLLYRFFGWEDVMPQFAHLPLILKPDGNGKLSKRDGDRLGFPVFPTEWKDPASGDLHSGYRESGYLPEAVINILAHLGWNPGTEQELFSMEELIDQFSLERVGRHGSKFDPEKAKWFNHQYIQRRPVSDLAAMLVDEAAVHHVKVLQAYAEKVILLTRERSFLLPDLWNQSWFFFLRPETYDLQVLNKIWQANTAEITGKLWEEAMKLDQFDKETLHALVQDFTSRNGIKTGQLMNPLRLLVVGSNQGPGMMDIAGVLGKEEFLGRVSTGLKRLAES